MTNPKATHEVKWKCVQCGNFRLMDASATKDDFCCRHCFSLHGISTEFREQHPFSAANTEAVPESVIIDGIRWHGEYRDRQSLGYEWFPPKAWEYIDRLLREYDKFESQLAEKDARIVELESALKEKGNP
jgi:hypothetical protein